MARKEQPWFRFYVEALHDRKLRRLKPEQRWVWVAVLGAAKRSPVAGHLLIGEGQPMDEHDVADIAAVPVKTAKAAIAEFDQAGMIAFDETAGCWCVTKWKQRQYESDSSTARTRKHRAKEQEPDPEPPPLERSNDDGRNVPTTSQERPKEQTASVTETEAETEAETETDPAATTSDHRAPDDPASAAAADPDATVRQALALLVDRAVARSPAHTNPTGHRKAIVAGIRTDHLDDAHDLLQRDPGLTAEQLADLLDPPPTASPPATPGDDSVQRHRAFELLSNPRCPQCSGTTWLRAELLDDGTWGPVQPCPDCNPEARTA